ncbi:hypothetical protein ACHAPT_011459 [Fusarium lateritium]
MDASTADRPSKEASSKNPVPHPSVDITQTKLWVSLKNPALLDVNGAVVHNNLEVLAALIQAQSRTILELVEGQKKSEEDSRILKSDARAILKALGEDVASETSRRSSINNRRSSVAGGLDGIAAEDQDPGHAALEKFIENAEILDSYFESFILGSKKTPLTRHTKNLTAFSEAFKAAAKTQLAGYLGEESANEIIEQLSLFDQGQLDEAYMAMSRRYRANKDKGKGKKVTTVTEGFHTDVDGRGEGSQSTDTHTPRRTRSGRVPPKTPRKARSSPSLFVESGGDDEEEA